MEGCKGNINNFCYVCGEFTPLNEQNRGKISTEFKNAYLMYYLRNLEVNVNWAPDRVCKTCYGTLLQWMKRERKSMHYGKPMIWTDPGVHNQENCYACANTVPGMNKVKAKSHKYKGVPSAERPVTHTDGNIPIPPYPDQSEQTTTANADALTEPTTTGIETENYSVFDPGLAFSSNAPIPLVQQQLDYIVSKLELSQRKSETLATFLKSNNLLAHGTKVTAYRKRQLVFQQFFTLNEEKTFAFCNDIDKLMEIMEIFYIAEDWRLFIDSSKSSLKAVLLHKTNSKPSIPIAFGSDTKETYDKMKLILEKINYEKHQWRICCDLKVVAMLCGLQGGYTKHMCYLCDWNTRFKGNHYRTRTWQDRDVSDLGTANMPRQPLVPRNKILLPYLHIKLGMVKNLIKTAAKRDEVLHSLKDIFKRISINKLKNGVI